MREKLIYISGGLGTLLLVWNLYTIFLVIHDEAQQGAIGRMVLIHPPIGIAAYFFYFAALVSSILFLTTKDFKHDSIAVSCIEVGTVYTLANLVTGSLWAHVIW